MAKRRANGEGSIRKRKDGRWEGRYTAGRDPVTGKAIYKNVLGKSQSEVKQKLKAAQEENAKVDIAMLVSRIMRQSSHIFCPIVKQKFNLVMHRHPRPFLLSYSPAPLLQ